MASMLRSLAKRGLSKNIPLYSVSATDTRDLTKSLPIFGDCGTKKTHTEAASDFSPYKHALPLLAFTKSAHGILGAPKWGCASPICYHDIQLDFYGWKQLGIASRSYSSIAGEAQSGANPAAAQDPSSQPSTSGDVIYYGPLASNHKLLKRISIANTFIACAAAPYIFFYSEHSLVSRVGIGTSLVLFGLLTTGALHWLTHPYVHELHYSAATQLFRVRTTNIFSQNKWHEFSLQDVKPLPWDRPIATFMARDNFYYIDTFAFPDKELLKKLTPEDMPLGKADDEDDD